jgi:hypothetical protein
MKRRHALLAAVLLLAGLLPACGSECNRCSSDDDCEAGFVCTTFSDGSKRCGSGVGATTCRVR